MGKGKSCMARQIFSTWCWLNSADRSITSFHQDLMTQNGISYVLNASNSCPKPDFICDSHFMRIPVNDNYCEKLLPWLDKSIEFIGELSLQRLQTLRFSAFKTCPPWSYSQQPLFFHTEAAGWGGKLESFCTPSLTTMMLFSVSSTVLQTRPRCPAAR